MVKNEIIPIEKLKQSIIEFVDSNGSDSCGYCNGNKSEQSSDHPKKAVISLSHDASTSNEAFVAVQDELTKAYFH